MPNVTDEEVTHIVTQALADCNEDMASALRLLATHVVSLEKAASVGYRRLDQLGKTK